MLRLGDLYGGLHRLAASSAEQASDRERRRAHAVTAFGQHGGRAEWLRQRAADARTSWLVADFDGPPTATTPCPPVPADYLVASVDGSQIFPDRHGLANCYVINLGQVVLEYGAGARASLGSQPLLFADEEDVYLGEVGDRRAVGAGEVAIHRSVVELEHLLELSRALADRPVVALADGTLIPWTIEAERDPWRRAMLDRYLAALAGFEAAGVPIASYISRSGGSDVIHLVRVGDCDQLRVNCDRCGHLAAVVARSPRGRQISLAQAAELPCGPAAGLCDADLFGDLLTEQARSAPFITRSKSFDGHPEQRVGFFYLRTVDEVARVETPCWVTQRPDWLARVHAVVADQVTKGRGYPVALQEAHEQAVVRAPDRAAFERLLERLLVQGHGVVRWSSKGRSKQQPGV